MELRPCVNSVTRGCVYFSRRFILLDEKRELRSKLFTRISDFFTALHRVRARSNRARRNLTNCLRPHVPFIRVTSANRVRRKVPISAPPHRDFVILYFPTSFSKLPIHTYIYCNMHMMRVSYIYIIIYLYTYGALQKRYTRTVI